MTSPSEVVRATTIHVETSAAAVPASLIAVAGTAIAFASGPLDTTWVGRPNNTGLYLTVFGFAIAGCLALIAGYLSGRSLATDSTAIYRRSSRSVLTLVSYRVLGDFIWLTAGLSIAAAAALLRTLLIGGGIAMGIWPLVLLASSSVLASYTFGLVLGALLLHAAGAAILAPLPYAATLFSSSVLGLSSMPQLQQIVAPYIDQSWDPVLVPNVVPILALVGYVLGVAATCMAAACIIVSRRLRRPNLPLWMATAATLATVAFGLAVIIPWTPNGFARMNPGGVACASASGHVCVWESQEARLSDWVTAEESVYLVAQRLEPDSQRLRIMQVGIDLEGPEDRSLELFNPVPTVTELRLAIAEVYVAAMLAQCVDAPGYGAAFSEMMGLFVDELGGRADSPGVAGGLSVDSIRAEHCG